MHIFVSVTVAWLSCEIEPRPRVLRRHVAVFGNCDRHGYVFPVGERTFGVFGFWLAFDLSLRLYELTIARFKVVYSHGWPAALSR